MPWREISGLEVRPPRPMFPLLELLPNRLTLTHAAGNRVHTALGTLRSVLLPCELGSNYSASPALRYWTAHIRAAKSL